MILLLFRKYDNFSFFIFMFKRLSQNRKVFAFIIFIIIYRVEIQGLRPPNDRSIEDDFDIASKYHVITSVPYIR